MLRYNTSVTVKVKDREPKWYNESAKRHRPQKGSLYEKDITGSATPSTNDETSGRA
jgi:hypothetical protein